MMSENLWMPFFVIYLTYDSISIDCIYEQYRFHQRMVKAGLKLQFYEWKNSKLKVLSMLVALIGISFHWFYSHRLDKLNALYREILRSHTYTHPQIHMWKLPFFFHCVPFILIKRKFTFTCFNIQAILLFKHLIRLLLCDER